MRGFWPCLIGWFLWCIVVVIAALAPYAFAVVWAVRRRKFIVYLLSHFDRGVDVNERAEQLWPDSVIQSSRLRASSNSNIIIVSRRGALSQGSFEIILHRSKAN